MRKEAPIQRAIVKYLRAQYPAWIVHHSKNEINKSGKDIAREIGQAKLAGMVVGWPDLIIMAPSHVGPLFFEVKAEGGYPTDAQRAVHDRLRALGYRVGIVRSIADVDERLAAWGVA